MIWIAALLLSLACALVLLLPLVRGGDGVDERRAALGVYGAQLDELERDGARGLIAPDEAKAARLEIERRILRLDGAKPARLGGGGRAMVGLAVLLVPAAALGLYAYLGTPSLPDQPLALRERPAGPDPRLMVASLETRLADDPNDVDGWLMLARSKDALNDPDGAVTALRRAREVAPDDARLPGALGEALVIANDGTVPPEALALFNEAGQKAPNDPRPAFYLAQADLQSGREARALERLKSLLAVTPPDAPWRDQAEAMLREAASATGADADALIADASPPPAATTPPTTAALAPPGDGASPPSDDAAAAVAALPPEERQAQIETMVAGLADRLAKEGGSAEEWHRLARSQAVLGRHDAAEAAYAKARELAPKDTTILKDEATFLLGPPEGPVNLPTVTAAAAERFERVRGIDPADPEPFWYLGIRALQTGDRPKALALWRDLLERLPEDHPDRGAVEELIGALEGKAAG